MAEESHDGMLDARREEAMLEGMFSGDREKMAAFEVWLVGRDMQPVMRRVELEMELEPLDTTKPRDQMA